MDGDRAGARLAIDTQQIGHLHGRAGGIREQYMDIDELIEAQWRPVGDEDLEDCEINAGGAQLVIGVSDRAQVFDAALLEVGQIPAVVDDSHGVGLGEADPESVTERVVVGIE